MKTSRRPLLASVGLFAIVAFLALPAAEEADAFCRIGREWSWEGREEIPVFLRDDTHQWLLHRDMRPWSQQELIWEIEYALEVANDTSGAAHPPFVYRGTTDKKRIRHAIVIQPTPLEPEDRCGVTSLSNTRPDQGQEVRLGIATFPCNVRWEHWTTTSGALVMRGVLLHELGHALGLGHANGGSSGGGCADPPGAPITDCVPFCGVMAIGTGFSWEGESYYLDDVLGLQAIYPGPYPPGPQDHEESPDGLFWFAAPSTPGPPVRSSFGDASSSPDQRMVFTSRGFRLNQPQLDVWDFPSGDWRVWWRGPREWRQIGEVGAAARPSPFAAYGFFELNQGEFLIRDPQKHARKLHLWTVHTERGNPDRFFTHETEATNRHGIDGAYDPVTGDRFAVWRDSDNRIRIVWIDGDTDAVKRSFRLDQVAYDNPEIACGQTASTPFRCLIVYSTAAEEGSGTHAHVTRWWQFEPSVVPIINGVRFELRGFERTMQNGYLQFGPVSVAYNEARDLFLFAWKNPGRCWYTAVKEPAPTAPWRNERSHCETGRFSSAPTVGAASRSFEGINNARP